jgi:hypothetical protein
VRETLWNLGEDREIYQQDHFQQQNVFFCVNEFFSMREILLRYFMTFSMRKWIGALKHFLNQFLANLGA